MKKNNPLAHDKELGQHFLVNQGIIEKILCKVQFFNSQLKTKEVIEIGPGGGALTQALLRAGIRVVAVEFDERWVSFLTDKYSHEKENGQLVLVHEDATLVDLEKLRSQLQNQETLLCGNLPYNRGQEIVMRYFEEASFVQAFVVMLQKEVSDKFLPKNERRTYGPQSIKFHFLTSGTESFPVSPGSFQPPPKVESSVLSFIRKAYPEIDPFGAQENYRDFSTFLRKAFSQRRKKLSNNICKRAQFPQPFEAYADKRAEELSPEEFIALWKAFKSF
jgi:16S rRNA (adenine1518-N6/adenine1519-N6)-dimethyltransferase